MARPIMATAVVHLADAVPFSPVPSHQIAMPFRGDIDEGAWSSYTFMGSPLRVLWEEAYRRSALDAAIGDFENARLHARRGIGMEDAYIVRVRAEAKQVAA